MKRILLATSALCLGAGMAVAMDKGATHNMSDGMGMSHGMGMSDGMMMEKPAVTLSGDGRMGIVSDADDNLKFDSRVRITVKAAATLDNGLSAGGEVRTDQDGTGGKAGKIFLSGPFGTLTMGDVDAGAKAAVGNVASVGYRNLDDPNEITYLRGGAGDDPTLQYMLPKMGPVQVWGSVGMVKTDVKDEDGKQQYVPDSFVFNKKTGLSEPTKKTMTEISADTLSVGAKVDLTFADMGTAWIGGGFEATTDDTEDGHLVVGAGVEASGFTGTVVVGMQGRDTNDADGNPIEMDDDGNAVDRDREQFAVSAGYSAGQIGVTVFYTDDTDFKGAEAAGAGFSWSLGGGASLNGGITNWPQDKGEDKQTADLGVKFSF